jgi:hypothetical protein
MVVARISLRCTEPSTISRVKLACVDQPTTPDRGFTTFAIDSLSTPSLSGIGPAKILNGAYPCCLPFWVMLMWLILIGIFPFIRS